MELGVKRVLHITAPLWVLRAVCFAGEKLARLTGNIPTLNSDKYRIMRQRNWQCDISPAREELGYAPKSPLVRGVKAAVLVPPRGLAVGIGRHQMVPITCKNKLKSGICILSIAFGFDNL